MENNWSDLIDAAQAQPVPANPPLLELFNTNRESIGRLEITEDGFLTFMGDVDASAKKFFEAIIAHNSQRVIAYRNALQEIKEKSKETGVHVILDRVL